MRFIVCGGRDYNDLDAVRRALDLLHAKYPISLIIEGGASGADSVAREWASSNGLPWKTFHADWRKYGKRAGPLRNGEMIEYGYPDGLVAFPGGIGTADMIRQARDAGVSVWQPYG